MTPIVDSEWRKLDGTITREPIAKTIENALLAEQASNTPIKICIGSDSQVYRSEIEFATVILILRKGKGGYMYISNFRSKVKMSLKERMLFEVSRSIEIAYHLCPLFDKYKTELEVHADINTNPRFKSNTALQEAMGYIMSMGFTFKGKPDAIAATCCANKAV